MVNVRASVSGRATPAASPAAMHRTSQSRLRASWRMVCSPSASCAASSGRERRAVADLKSRLFDSNITVKGMNPAFVGLYLFEAVEENHMYKVPHMHTHEQIRARHRRIESDLEREEALTYCAFPSEHWTRIRTDNVIERLNREIRRIRVVGTFPDGNSALMLVCARLRHAAGTQWGCKKYINMKHLGAALDDASIAG